MRRRLTALRQCSGSTLWAKQRRPGSIPGCGVQIFSRGTSSICSLYTSQGNIYLPPICRLDSLIYHTAVVTCQYIISPSSHHGLALQHIARNSAELETFNVIEFELVVPHIEVSMRLRLTALCQCSGSTLWAKRRRPGSGLGWDV